MATLRITLRCCLLESELLPFAVLIIMYYFRYVTHRRTCMSLNSNARAVCQSITAHAVRIPRHALIFLLHCFSKQPLLRLSNRLWTSTLPCQGGLDGDAEEVCACSPEGWSDPPSFAVAGTTAAGSPMPECSTMNLHAPWYRRRS